MKDGLATEHEPQPDLSVAVTMSNPKSEPAAQSDGDFFDSQKAYAVKASENSVATLDKTRGRGDVWGKTVMSLGTALVTALGITSLVQVFPVSDKGGWFAVGISIIFFLIAVGGVITVGAAISIITEPVVMRAKLEDMTGHLSPAENALVLDMYTRFARVNGKETMWQYVREAYAIERVNTELEERLGKGGRDFTEEEQKLIIDSVWVPGDDSDAREAAERALTKTIHDINTNKTTTLKRAAAIRAEVKATMDAASVAVARHRVVQTLKKWTTKVGLFAIPFGLVLALMSADFASSNGSRPKELAESNKACVDLVEAAQKQRMTVSDGCKKVALPTKQEEPAEPLPTDPVQEGRSKALTALVEQYNACITDPKTEPAVKVTCDQVLATILQIAAP